MSCVIGLDIGTTSTIGILVRLPETVLGIVSRPVTLVSRNPGWAEEDPEQWWRNSCAIIRQLIADSGIPPTEVAGIGVTGMLPAVVLLDEEGRVLRPSIQQSDGRCAAEVEELRAEIDEPAFVRRAGNGVNQQLVASKLRWIEKHEPAVFPKISTVFGSYDYINWRLTGEKRIEQNWALEAGFVDLARHETAADLIAYTHLPAEAVPAMSSGRPIRFSGAPAAIWSPKASSVAAIIFDSNGPGAMAFTVMAGASRLARWRVSRCTAAFDAE